MVVSRKPIRGRVVGTRHMSGHEHYLMHMEENVPRDFRRTRSTIIWFSLIYLVWLRIWARAVIVCRGLNVSQTFIRCRDLNISRTLIRWRGLNISRALIRCRALTSSGFIKMSVPLTFRAYSRIPVVEIYHICPRRLNARDTSVDLNKVGACLVRTDFNPVFLSFPGRASRFKIHHKNSNDMWF